MSEICSKTAIGIGNGAELPSLSPKQGEIAL